MTRTLHQTRKPGRVLRTLKAERHPYGIYLLPNIYIYRAGRLYSGIRISFLKYSLIYTRICHNL